MKTTNQQTKISPYRRISDSGEEWISAPNNGGDLGGFPGINEELNGLLCALHDAINLPQGVVPESAKRFYQGTEMDHDCERQK